MQSTVQHASGNFLHQSCYVNIRSVSGAVQTEQAIPLSPQGEWSPLQDPRSNCAGDAATDTMQDVGVPLLLPVPAFAVLISQAVRCPSEC